MPLVCPWRQGTTDRDVTPRLKFSQPERIPFVEQSSRLPFSIDEEKTPGFLPNAITCFSSYDVVPLKRWGKRISSMK